MVKAGFESTCVLCTNFYSFHYNQIFEVICEGITLTYLSNGLAGLLYPGFDWLQ